MSGAQERRARERRGHTAEWAASLALMLRGYRILARREKTPLGEIDLIAVRGGRVAFVEVKRRATREAAEASITSAQRARIRKAASLWPRQKQRLSSLPDRVRHRLLHRRQLAATP